MSLRAQELSIPDETPFQHDALEREKSVRFLANIIANTKAPYVLALNSPWGTGKTTMVRMLQSVLSADKFQCVYFNAWEVDHMLDPLVPMVSVIDELNVEHGVFGTKAQENLKKLRSAATCIVKRTAVTVIKVVSAGVVDVDNIIDHVKEDLSSHAAGDIVGEFQKKKEQTLNFKKSLEQTVACLDENDKKPTLIFFIDELDRCRPTFAIELLERVKHYFDVENIIFVLSIDKEQIEAATRSVYGEGINAPEYLRRFIDIEFKLPTMKSEKFTQSLLKRFGLDEKFQSRSTRFAQDKAHFVQFFTQFADIFDLSLRVRERCIARLKVVLDQSEDHLDVSPTILSLLLILRLKNEKLYDDFVKGSSGSAEVIHYIKSFPEGESFMGSRRSAYIEAKIVTADQDEKRIDAANKKYVDLLNSDQSDGEMRERLSVIVNEVSRHRFDGAHINNIVHKIDLASYVNS